MNYEAPPPYDPTKGAYPPNPNPASYQPNMSNPSMPYPNAPPMQAQPVTQTYVYVNDQCQYGPRPMNVTCPHCHQQIVTKVKCSAGLLTWLLFGGCLVVGCWLGCCLIPFCMDDCQDVEHYCSNCNSFLGNYKRL